MMDFKKTDKKWQKRWEEKAIFRADDSSKKKKFYMLEMWPYPSAEGLHMGHAFNYVVGDAFARFKRMKGFNVLYPMGYDALGLPAENAAIKAKTHPKDYTDKSIANFIRQQKFLGLSYDWSRMLSTHEPSYYIWDQWIFLKMLEKGLAYRKSAPVNWCPKCETTLANEQVHGGKCWRHEDTDIEMRQLEQWFFKITNYAEELYDNIDNLVNWPDDIKAMQKNWIGKSHGTEIDFEINGKKWPIFTTRPDTIYGVTFMVISAQHPDLSKIVTKGQKKIVDDFIKKIKSTSQKDTDVLEKEGVFTGSYAINPVTNDKVPVYAGNFVVADYGCGMVMAVPAHDQRDFEFAKKYEIPIKIVIQPQGGNINVKTLGRAFVGEGVLVNSGPFDGMLSTKAISEISKYIEKSKVGRKVIQYRLKDWLLSRQRYWGTPIPVVYCGKCGIVPVPEKDLPVELPKNVKFGEGNPLLTNEGFVKTKCPKCKGPAKRETDTMDTFVNSSWYFLRYCDPKNTKKIFDEKKVRYWMPIDQYIGGKEHACMHLIYFRFYTKFFRDLGLLKLDEPTFNLFNQGMIHGSDGAVMSKSRGNVIDPMDMINKYGADTLRIYLISTAGADKDFVWSDKAIEGTFKLIKKFAGLAELKFGRTGVMDKLIKSKTERALQSVARDIERFRYNIAIRDITALVNNIYRYNNQISKSVFDDAFEKLILMSAPFMPHVCEELWAELGKKGFVSLAELPEPDVKSINMKVEASADVVDQVISDVIEIKKLIQIEPKKATIFVCAPWKYDVFKMVEDGKTIKEMMKDEKYRKVGKELANYITKLEKRKPLDELFLTSTSEMDALDGSKEFLEKALGFKVEIVSASDSDNPKAKSAEPGKPGILIE